MSAPAPTDESSPPATANPLDLLRERSYIVLLVFGTLVGAPVAFIAYFFLQLVTVVQDWLFKTLPVDLGFTTPPNWWPVPILAIAGLLVAGAIIYLPGTGGHSPAAGLTASGPPAAVELPGIVVAAFISLAFGAVVGPEAPLIAIGGGLAALAVHLVKRDAPQQAIVVIGAAGSFAAISTLLGSPLLGAFLLMEVAGLAGPMIGVVLVPGLLAAGIGSLVFLGLNDLTGFGTFSLGVPNLPPFTHLDGYEFMWAIAIGILGAIVGTGILRFARYLEPHVANRPLLITPVLGVGVGVLALVFATITSHGTGQVLFSGENSLAPLIDNASTFTAGALVALALCKGLAYGLSLSSFRGGPTFPAMFIGAAGGIALSHLPGLPMIAGVAMGIGAMAVAILRLPLTAVLLTVVFLQADGLTLTPLIIVAVVVAYVASVRLTPRDPAPEPTEAAPST